MGILDLMLGSSGPGEQGVEGQSYTLSKETHDFVYPVAVRREEVAAFVQLIEAEADAPYVEEETEELQDVFDDVLGDAGIDAADLAEQKRRTRLAVEPIIDHWHEQVGADGDGGEDEDEAEAGGSTDSSDNTTRDGDRAADIATVYARPGTDDRLLAFTKLCKQRDEQPDDPFELPASFTDAAALLTRLRDATDSQYRAVVHTDLLE
ncbi:hypothetical protein C482_19726 [Natrialba chahannaoensis JCM 10990]|uniref:Uncharacterized protein n=1 Tax=Natrialba chahannaoensis JCM 10990 TaxID=1227492 RepID=M0A7C0_9EURY|nr:hypothetical protein [Natrialba chahannaoensis]ELY93233.1 hypothetical protein C482_19726 [Natrialba chahannaoensis JCM 10990]